MLDVYLIKHEKFRRIEEPCIIADAVDDINEMFATVAEAKGIILSMLDIDVVPFEMTTDERRLKQILINLISNALKFTPAGGKITVKASFDTESKMLSFSVKDTGIGIRRVDQVKLFRMFGKLHATNRQN